MLTSLGLESLILETANRSRVRKNKSLNLAKNFVKTIGSSKQSNPFIAFESANIESIKFDYAVKSSELTATIMRSMIKTGALSLEAGPEKISGKDKLVYTFKKFVGFIKTSIMKIWNWLKNIFIKIFNSISNFVKSIVSYFQKGAVKSKLDKLSKLINKDEIIKGANKTDDIKNIEGTPYSITKGTPKNLKILNSFFKDSVKEIVDYLEKADDSSGSNKLSKIVSERDLESLKAYYNGVKTILGKIEKVEKKEVNTKLANEIRSFNDDPNFSKFFNSKNSGDGDRDIEDIVEEQRNMFIDNIVNSISDGDNKEVLKKLKEDKNSKIDAKFAKTVTEDFVLGGDKETVAEIIKTISEAKELLGKTNSIKAFADAVDASTKATKSLEKFVKKFDSIKIKIENLSLDIENISKLMEEKSRTIDVNNEDLNELASNVRNSYTIVNKRYLTKYKLLKDMSLFLTNMCFYYWNTLNRVVSDYTSLCNKLYTFGSGKDDDKSKEK